ncbi:MAG: AraC family transcriptional regulator [Gammaproteobacteria bacterium]|nr:AraC family transcriptional regulator [Gammaproteobacteria bacterium]
MEDRLAAVLARFTLRARVFHAGALCVDERFDAATGVGYLHVVEHGRLAFSGAGVRRRVIAAPALVFLPRPVRHRLMPLAGEAVGTVCASVEFGAALANPLTTAVPPVVTLPLTPGDTLAAAVALLFREAGEWHCGRQAVVDRLAEVVVILLLRHLMDAGLVASGVLAGLAEPRLARAINAMHEDPARAWTLPALAGVAGLSRARFAAHFVAVVGQTPAAYLAAWRIALAQAALLRGRPVAVVAADVGYDSASALARAFGRIVGCSPRAWLRARREGGAS